MGRPGCDAECGQCLEEEVKGVALPICVVLLRELLLCGSCGRMKAPGRRTEQDVVQNVDPNAKSVGSNKLVKGRIAASVAVVLDCGDHCGNDQLEQAFAIK